MKVLDERTRARLAETGELFAGYAPAMEDVHCRNADALGEEGGVALRSGARSC